MLTPAGHARERSVPAAETVTVGPLGAPGSRPREEGLEGWGGEGGRDREDASIQGLSSSPAHSPPHPHTHHPVTVLQPLPALKRPQLLTS